MKKILILLSLLFCSACSVWTDLGSAIKEGVQGRDRGVELETLPEISQATIEIDTLWRTTLGASEDYDFSPFYNRDHVYSASHAGGLAKFKQKTGQMVWRKQLPTLLSSGINGDSQVILLGDTKGYILAFDPDGKELWKTKVGSQVLGVPQMEGNTIVVRCVNNQVFGLSSEDGKIKWRYEHPLSVLNLKNSASLAIDSGVAYIGFSGGKLVALAVEDGRVLWVVSVAVTKGKTEIERINEISSNPVVQGKFVYVVTYQGKVACIDRTTATIVWSRDISSYNGLAIDDNKIYLAHVNGTLYALDSETGKTYWKQGQLVNRQLTTPLVVDNYVVVGDVTGTLHFIHPEDGTFTGRISLENSPIMPRLTSTSSNTLFVQNRAGSIYALSFQKVKSRKN